MPLQQSQNSIPAQDSKQDTGIYACPLPYYFQAGIYMLLFLAGINEGYEWQ